MKKAVILDRAKRKTAKGLPLTDEEKQAILEHDGRRKYMREYMRRYRDAHPEYCKRNSEKCSQNKKADPEKWREYNRKYRAKLKNSNKFIVFN